MTKSSGHLTDHFTDLEVPTTAYAAMDPERLGTGTTDQKACTTNRYRPGGGLEGQYVVVPSAIEAGKGRLGREMFRIACVQVAECICQINLSQICHLKDVEQQLGKHQPVITELAGEFFVCHGFSVICSMVVSLR